MKAKPQRIRLALLLLIAFANSWAYDYSINNNGTTVGVDPLATNSSASDYYNLFNWSGHPSFGTQPDTVFMWLHEDSSNGDVSLSIIMDDINDPNGGRLSSVFSGLPTGAFIGLSDDGVELSMAGATSANGNWRWYTCCTDGGVIAGLNNGSWDIDFDVSSYSGLSAASWYFLSGDASAPSTAMAFDPTQTLTISRHESSAVPTPATAALLLLGVVLIRRRLKHS